MIFSRSFSCHISRDRGCHELGIVTHMHMTLSLLVHVGHPFLLKTLYSWSEPASIFVNSTLIQMLFIGAESIKTSIPLLEID